MAVTFPASQLRIIDYNRVVRDLNGLTPAEFLERVSESFDVVEMGNEIYKPNALHNFGMYLDVYSKISAMIFMLIFGG